MISPEPTQAGRAWLLALREHLRRQPDDGQAWLKLAQALAQAAAQAEAEAAQPEATDAELHHALEQAIKSMPEALDAWLLAARVHQLQRGPSAALQWLRYTARQNPQLEAPRAALAVLQADACRQAGRWAEALAAYREVEKFRAGDPWLHNNIGTCLASLEEFGQARGYFDKALRLRPDFPEARLNLAFLNACQGRDGDAARTIDKILQDPGLAPATLRAAATLRDILHEHQRLEPFLRAALQSGEVQALQQALADSPATLSQPHEPTLVKLRALAAQCERLVFDPLELRYAGDTEALPLVEAFTQCKLAGGSAALAALRAATSAAAPNAGADANQRRFLDLLSVIRDRARHDPRLLHGPDGEAWLRYWHARLLHDTPERKPGQYKLATNTDGLPTTPAECVGFTYRVFLSEFLPSAPAGIARGLLVYVAVNMIHGFGDGNGRLSRFLLAWETESAGLPPLLIPLELRSQAARAVNAARLTGELHPLVEVVKLAHAATGRILSELHASGPDVTT